jgi:hypothetical protein
MGDFFLDGDLNDHDIPDFGYDDNPYEDTGLREVPLTPEQVDEALRVFRDYFSSCGVRIPECTCVNCQGAEKCSWGYDTYNTDGDCLAEK